MYHLFDAYLLSAFVCALAAWLGALVFGAAAVPSVLLNNLAEPDAARVLRAYWPRYHRVAVFTGVILTIAIAVVVPTDALPPIYTLMLSALAAIMTICFFVGLRLIGAVNAAKDAGDLTAFRRLHRLDIALVGFGLLAGLALLCATVYVLPGQFTFWQQG